MRVRFQGYNYDIETRPGSYDNYYGGYIEPSYAEIDIDGTVKGYVRDDGVTYAIVLSDNLQLFTVGLNDLTVLGDTK